MSNVNIIANHAHVFPKSFREDGTVDSLKALMDECGILKAVAFAPFSDMVENPNSWLAAELNGEDRLLGFGTVDFSKENIKDQVNEIFALGFRGIKLHPAYQKFSLVSEKAFEVYGQAEKLGLLLSFHTGIHWHRIQDYNVILHDEIAYHFKNLKFTMEHVGGYAYFDQAVGVLCNNPKTTFAGLTSVFDWGMNKFWYLNENRLKDLIHLIGAERCIFGLDFPYNDVEKTKHGIAVLNGLGLTDEQKQMIFGGTLTHLLDI